MPETLTFEEAQDSPQSLSFEEAKRAEPESISFEEATERISLTAPVSEEFSSRLRSLGVGPALDVSESPTLSAALDKLQKQTEIPQLRQYVPPTIEEQLMSGAMPEADKEAEREALAKQREIDEAKKTRGLEALSNEDFFQRDPEMGEKYGGLRTDRLAAPRLSTQEAASVVGNKLAGPVAGTQGAIADLTDFLTSGPGVLTLMGGEVGGAGVGQNARLGQALQNLIKRGFAADMAYHLPDQFQQVYEAAQRGDSKAAVQGTLNAAVALGVIKHGAESFKPAVEIPIAREARATGPQVTKAEPAALDLKGLQEALTANQVKRPEASANSPEANRVERAIEELKAGEKVDVSAPASAEKSDDVAEAIAKEIQQKQAERQQVPEETPSEAPKTPRIVSAVIKVGDQYFEAPSHPEAMLKAVEAGAIKQDAQGIWRDKNGADIEMTSDVDLFRTSDGSIIHRDDARELSGKNRAEDLGLPGWTAEKTQAAVNELTGRPGIEAKKRAVAKAMEEARQKEIERELKKKQQPVETDEDLQNQLAEMGQPDAPEEVYQEEKPSGPGSDVSAREQSVHSEPEGQGESVGSPGTDVKGEESAEKSADTAEPADRVLAALAKAREVVDPLRALKRGELHAMALPEWMARTVADAALRVIEQSYKLGNTLYHAIEEGVKWLREQGLPNFNEHEARDYLTNATHEARIAGPSAREKILGTEQEIADARARAAAQENPASTPITGPKEERRVKPVSETPADQVTGSRDWRTVQDEMHQAGADIRAKLKSPRDKQGQALATANFRLLEEELHNHPGYVEYLLTRTEELNKKIKEARDAGEEHSRLRRDLEEVNESLKKVPPKLVNTTYGRLQDAGVIAKPPPAKPVGRSLDTVVDELLDRDIDSPRRTLRERLGIARRWAEGKQEIKDVAERTRLAVGASWKAGVESLRSPPADSGFRNVLKDWIFYDQWTGHQTRRWMNAINKKIENPRRQMAMSVWLDANGDEGRLRFEEAQVPKKWQDVWRLALNLTKDERDIALRVKEDFAAKLEDSKMVGLIEKGRQDYGVPQRWEKAPPPKTDQAYATKDGPKGSPGHWAAKLDPRDPFFAFQREYPNYFEGIMAGGEPEDLRISTLVGVYNEAMHKALSSRAAIWGMRNEVASDGMPLVKISGLVREAKDKEPGTYFVDAGARGPGDTSKDGRPYQKVDHFALRDWKIAYKTAGDQPIMVKGDFLVHPDVAEFLKNELEASPLKQGKIGRVLKPAFALNRFLKESKLALGAFHLATIGEHAVFHLVNPFKNGFAIDLRDRDQALLVRNGLELGLSGPQAAFEEGVVSGRGGLFGKIPGLGDGSRAFSDWLFKDYIPTISMKAGLEALRRNRKRYGSELSESQIAELTAHQMNAAFGLQNYRLLGRSKVLQDLGSLGFLAPQFLESRLKVVAQALKPYGAEQRMMLALQAGTLYVGARLLSAWLDDDPHWEAENAFRVVYHGRSYGLRTIVSDAWEMREFSRFMSGRVSPLYKTLHETAFQRDMRTGARKEPPIPTNWMPGRVSQNLLVDFARWMLPAGFEGVTPGAAGRDQGPVTTAMATVGIGSHKYTPETEVGGWARDFNRHSDDPATVTHQRQRDSESHVDGAYRKLDTLLDAGKFDDAITEYNALVQDGHAPSRIAQRYEHAPGQSFTGNKTRESSFKASLSEGQKEVYQRALAERKTRLEAFHQMLATLRSAGH